MTDLQIGLLCLSSNVLMHIFIEFSFPRYNGQIPGGDRGRRKSKFQLKQRSHANGLKAQRQHLCKNADEVQVIEKTNNSIDFEKKSNNIFDFK